MTPCLPTQTRRVQLGSMTELATFLRFYFDKYENSCISGKNLRFRCAFFLPPSEFGFILQIAAIDAGFSPLPPSPPFLL